MATAGTINGMVRSLMGDDDTAVYLDATLLVPSNLAYHLVQQKLINKGCTVNLNTSPVITLPASSTVPTVLGPATSPALPSDFIVPYKVWERPSGGDNTQWMLVDFGIELPDRNQYNYLGDVKFENGTLQFVGCSQDQDLKILYEQVLPDFVNTSSTVGILNAEDAIAFYTAAYMATSRGQLEMAAYFEKKGDEALETLAERFTHGNQAVHGRRRLAYGRRATGRH